MILKMARGNFVYRINHNPRIIKKIKKDLNSEKNQLIDLPYITISFNQYHHDCQNEEARRCMNAGELMRIYYSNDMFFSMIQQKRKDISIWGNLFELTEFTTRKIKERHGTVDLKLCYPTNYTKKKIDRLNKCLGLFDEDGVERAVMNLLLLLC